MIEFWSVVFTDKTDETENRWVQINAIYAEGFRYSLKKEGNYNEKWQICRKT